MLDLRLYLHAHTKHTAFGTDYCCWSNISMVEGKMDEDGSATNVFDRSVNKQHLHWPLQMTCGLVTSHMSCRFLPFQNTFSSLVTTLDVTCSSFTQRTPI